MALVKKAKELCKGDVTEWYSVLEVNRHGNHVIAKVQHNDGGISERVWENPETEVPLVKPN